MAMKKSYYTIDGQILGYKDVAGRKDFLTDALGSVTGEVDQTGTNRTFNGRYKPYGGMLWSSGSRGSFGWVGTLGYKSTGLKKSSHYIRARHYSETCGMWTTQDLFWSSMPAYLYVHSRVISMFDPTGYAGVKIYRDYADNVSTWPPTCGMFNVGWIFTTRGATGYIVQEIIRSFEVTMCDGHETGSQDKCKGGKFYEIWKVKDGDVYSYDGFEYFVQKYADDGWRRRGPGSCSQGWDMASGKLTFIPAKTVSLKDRDGDGMLKKLGFTYASQHPCSSTLPSTSNFNKPTNATNWHAAAFLGAKWGCCKKKKDAPPCKRVVKECEKCVVEGPCFDDIYSLKW